MPTLTVRFKKKILRKYPIKKGESLLIGRRSSYEIVIDNAAVSETHARIFSKGDDFYIEDLGSTNGTFVNKKRVGSKRLEDEDVITVGKHELVFCEYEPYTMEETMLPNALGQAYSTPWTTALDVSNSNKGL